MNPHLKNFTTSLALTLGGGGLLGTLPGCADGPGRVGSQEAFTSTFKATILSAEAKGNSVSVQMVRHAPDGVRLQLDVPSGEWQAHHYADGEVVVVEETVRRTVHSRPVERVAIQSPTTGAPPESSAQKRFDRGTVIATVPDGAVIAVRVTCDDGRRLTVPIVPEDAQALKLGTGSRVDLVTTRELVKSSSETVARSIVGTPEEIQRRKEAEQSSSSSSTIIFTPSGPIIF